jgi:hypothetical protein
MLSSAKRPAERTKLGIRHSSTLPGQHSRGAFAAQLSFPRAVQTLAVQRPQLETLIPSPGCSVSVSDWSGSPEQHDASTHSRHSHRRALTMLSPGLYGAFTG